MTVSPMSTNPSWQARLRVEPTVVSWLLATRERRGGGRGTGHRATSQSGTWGYV